jgi:hypothetical protein
MSEPMKIKVSFNKGTTKSILNFITETQEGKYTAKKPDLTQITYKRLQIQEQDKSYLFSDDVLLFGLSY